MVSRGVARSKQTLVQVLRREFPGYHGVVQTVRTAMRLEAESVRREQAGEAWVDLAKESASLHLKAWEFCQPKLKAVDLSSNGEKVQFNFAIGPPSERPVVIDSEPLNDDSKPKREKTARQKRKESDLAKLKRDNAAGEALLAAVSDGKAG